MMTTWMRSISARWRVAGGLCAAALLLMLVPTQAKDKPERSLGQHMAEQNSPPIQEHEDEPEDANEASEADDGNEPEPAPTAQAGNSAALEACACENAAGDGGCRSECNQSPDGKSAPNYCDGAKASPECWKCVKERCGVELPQ